MSGFISKHAFSSPNTQSSTSVYKQFEWVNEDPSLWTTQLSIQLLRNPSLAPLLISKLVEEQARAFWPDHWNTDNCLQEKIRKLGTHGVSSKTCHPSCCSNISRAFPRAITALSQTLGEDPKSWSSQSPICGAHPVSGSAPTPHLFCPQYN